MVSNKKEDKICFWGKDPNALFDPKYILELFPSSTMTYEQKLNAVSRMVLVLCVIFYIFSQSWRILPIGIITLGAIFIINKYNKQKNKKVRFSEGFETPATELLKDKDLPSDIFGEATDSNPLQNVLITDYETPTNKKPAPPSYTTQQQNKILEQTKKMIDDVNPEQPKISEKLFKGLEDSLAFEQSMRPFYSTSSTTIPNDQGAFADFCYGNMVSCKEGNLFACGRNLARHVN